MTPVISVVLPAYNHASFIAAAIESVLRQTFEDWELIIIDDGSSDETFEIISNFNDPRMHCYRQENVGSHATINRGLELARGAYIAILNSDDEYVPERLQKFVDAADGRKPGLYLSSVVLVDANGRPLPGDHWWNKMYQDILRLWDQTQSSVQTLFWGNYSVSTSNFFFDRSLLDLIGKFGHYRYVLDWDFVLRVAVYDEQAVTFLRHEALLRYRLHGANTILGGAIRNHVEAGYMLRRAARTLASRGGVVPPHAINRIHYLERFVRQKEVNNRIEKLREAEKYLATTLKHVSKLDDVILGHVRQIQDQDRYINELDVSLAGEKNRVLELQAYLQKSAIEFQNVYETLQVKSVAVERLETTIAAIHQSASWRLTMPLRWAGAIVRRVFHVHQALSVLRARKIEWGEIVLRGWRIFRQEGVYGLRHRVQKELGSPAPLPGGPAENQTLLREPYAQWLDEERHWIEQLRREGPILVGGLLPPTFSIVVPLHNTPPTMLQAMLDSVYAQIYPEWELCLCDDATTAPDTLRALDDLMSLSGPYAKKIRLQRRTNNGHIAVATNDALALATGDYIVLLDHDDELAPHALLRLAQEIAKDSSLDFIYSDEDKLDENNRRCQPFFKPDWSPALLWSQNYVGHLMCIRHDLIKRLGGMRVGMHGSQDHDLVLRIMACTSRVRHIPEILYHWRLHEGSVTVRPDGKPYAHGAGKQAVAAALTEKYPAHFLRVDDAPYLFVYEPRFRLPPQCLVSIIIPTKDKVDLLRPCIDSICEQSSWQNFEILILDNNSTEKETEEYLQALSQRDSRIRVIPARIPFNWSHLNNIGVAHAKGDVFIFLNNDTTVITPDWQERLAEYALLPDVGTVGAQLLYPDGSIQHAGVVVGSGLWADHVFKGQRPVHRVGPFVSSMVTRNVMANTGACMVISRERFSAIGGFDEEFEICGSDVEIGIRAHKMGLHNIYLATVQLTHFESKTRSSHVPENDFVQSEKKYAPYRLGGDPFYNPNLDVMKLVPSVLYPQ